MKTECRTSKKHLAATLFRISSFGFRHSLARFPNRRRNVTITFGLVMEVIHGDDLAVRPLDGARVANVPPAAVIAQDDLPTPGAPAVTAQTGANPVRHGA